MPSLQARQGLPSPAGAAVSPAFRIYVYDMPSEFTTRNLQWRGGASEGLHRYIRPDNVSEFTQGSLYAMESALHEWLLDSPLRTTNPAEVRGDHE